MRTAFAAVFTGLVALTALAAQPPKAADGKESLDGSYTLDAMTKGPMTITADMLKGKGEFVFVLKDGKLIPPAMGKKEAEEVTFKTDATASPKQIDTTSTKAGKKETSLGIYKMDGDLLTLVMAEPGTDRPKEFAAGDKVAVLKLKKKADKK